jgi:ADP-ribose pyrophosphatase
LTDETNKPAHGFVIKGRRQVAANSVFDIFFDHIAEPPDREVSDFLVVQPKHADPDGITGVCVLPIVAGRFALVNCYRHPVGQMSIEAPKGFVETGETSSQAALRELREETGLSCTAVNLVSLGTVIPEPGIINGRLALFVALDCTGKITIDATELGMASVRLFTAEELEGEIAGERIQDALTLLLFYRLRATLAVNLDAGGRTVGGPPHPTILR